MARLSKAFLLSSLLCLLFFGLAGNGIKNIQASLSGFNFSPAAIKGFIDRTGVHGWIVLIAIIHIISLAAVGIYKKTWSPINKICTISIANITVISWLSMPFTMFSKHTTSEVNAFISSFPKNFPANLLAANVTNTYADSNAMHLFGYERFYKKEIAIQDEVITPTLNSNYSHFLADSVARDFIASHPFAFFDKGGSIGLKSFTPNAFHFEVMTTKENTFTLVQQYNDKWNAYLDGKPMSISKAYKAFMQVKIPAGQHALTFQYEPGYILFLAITAICVVFVIIFFLVYKNWHPDERLQ